MHIVPRKLSRAVMRLKRVFVFLDAVLSVIQVVGHAMDVEAWLPRLAAIIPEQTLYTAKPRAGAEAIANAGLATRLSKALQVLSTGVQLSKEETVSSKEHCFASGPTWHDLRKRIGLPGEMKIQTTKIKQHPDITGNKFARSGAPCHDVSQWKRCFAGILKIMRSFY